MSNYAISNGVRLEMSEFGNARRGRELVNPVGVKVNCVSARTKTWL